MTKNDRLIAKFGTANIVDLLGPAGTIPPTQSIAMRLKELGISAGHVGRWVKQYIPVDLLSELEPYQKELQASQRKATFNERFGGNPMFNPESLSKLKATNNAKYGGNSPCHSKEVLSKIAQTNLSRYSCENVMHNSDIKAHHDAVVTEKFGGLSPLCDPSVASKFKATCQERFGGNAPACSIDVRHKMAETNLDRYGSVAPAGNAGVKSKISATNLAKYGGHPNSLSPSSILFRLRAQQLEPLEPIIGNSDVHKEIKVRCIRPNCGNVFITHLVSNPYHLPFHGSRYKCCECQSHGSKLEWFARDYIRERYNLSAEHWPHISWMANQEIDIYLKDLSIGFEINGYASHNSVATVMYGQPVGPGKALDYHQFKSQCCLEHGIKLYHFWYDTDSAGDRQRVMQFIDSVLSGIKMKPQPGQKVNRDEYPDPAEAGIPYTELPPEPFSSPYGICYNSGYWQF